MKNIKTHFAIVVFLALFLITGNSNLYAQTGLATPPQKKVVVPPSAEEVVTLRSAVVSHPADLTAHQAYIKAVGVTDPGIEKQYEEWMQKNPNDATIPFALGDAFANAESPKARTWLLKAVAIDPKLGKAYMDLWLDADRWGDFEMGRKYLGMGVAADPSNPDLSFYYASSLKESDLALYRKLSLDMAKNFPTHERGAQALYWLAFRSTDAKEKVTVWEQLRAQYPADKFSWSSSGMSSYFDYLLVTDPSKAQELAQSMANLKFSESQVKSWTGQVKLAQNIVKAKQLVADKKAAEALDVLNATKITSYSRFNDAFAILKSKAADAAGNTQAAYDSLAGYYAKSPTDYVAGELKQLGAKLGKNTTVINNEIMKTLNDAAKPATGFTLEQYLQSGTASLSDFKGKVVLITYWFPGCGPCRGEFPHFESVIKKFKGQDFVYLALNIVPEQDEYVIPFVKTSGYSFIPLRDVKDRNKGNLSNGNAAPVNFLIDKDGKVVFSKFRTDESNERTLELMINSLVKGKAI
ncbi:MAG: redoxin protein [Sediminibacterium sp.]|nr:redoxin protein [Sediminibacterium sp.]